MSQYCLAFVLGVVAMASLTMVDSAHAGENIYDKTKIGNLRYRRSLIPSNKNNATLYFAIDPTFSTTQREYILDKVRKFNNLSCVKYLPVVNNTQTRSVVFLPKNERCHTEPNGPHRTSYIHLNDHCFTQGWVMHEMGHALGLGHEHQRRDRDCYLEIDSSHQNGGDYKIMLDIDTSFPYDWKSFMHYRRSPDFKLRREFYENPLEELGTYEELSYKDIHKLNYFFCGGPHYCTIFSDECKKEKDFIASITPSCVYHD